MSFFRRIFISLISAVLTFGVVLAVLVVGAIWLFNSDGPKSPDGRPVAVVLRPGAGLHEIANSLEQGHVIRSASIFAAAAQATGVGRKLKAGEYEFASRASMSAVLDKLRRGEVARHFVTIPEGVTAEMAVDILMAQTILTGAAPVPPEGAILPDTYDVRRGEDRGAVLERMTNARDKLLAQLWRQRAPDLPFRTPEEAVIMASIVEKETAKPSERPMIARVFINRLQQGIRLQTDPTVIYGITRGRPLGRGIRRSELDAPTPYNTYAISGLPPTPIANPGRESLAAVMSPPEGEWLYFVADGTGGHAFAATLEEHNANVAKWRIIEHQKAGMAEAAPTVEDTPPPAAEPAPPVAETHKAEPAHKPEPAHKKGH
jgi:UPF0755 protein